MLQLILFGSFAQACLSWFLDFCFYQGNIFYAYYQWIEKKFAKSFWFKPLGGCAICSNVWQGFISFWLYCMLTHLPFTPALIGWWLIYLVTSNAMLRIMISKFD